MFNTISKIFCAVVLLRIIAMVGDVIHGPMKSIIVIILLVLGARMVFSKKDDSEDEDE